MSTLSSTYYDRLIGHARASFPNLIQIEEHIEDELKTEKLKDYQNLFEQSSNGTGGPIKRNFSNQRSEKNEKEVHEIFAPTPQYQKPYALVYRTMCSLPPIYHP